MPPVLHVAFWELLSGTPEQMLSHDLRLCMHQRHGVLQLIAESECAAGLVIAAARPKAAGQCLIEQPAIRKHVQRRVRCFDLHGAQRVLPVASHAIECGARGAGLPQSLCELTRSLDILARA